MRNWIAAAAASSCSPPAADPTASRNRNLRFTPRPHPGKQRRPAGQVASKIELVAERTPRATVQPAAPARIAPQPDPAAAEPAPILVVTPEPAPAPTPVAVADTPRPDPTGRELAPGATVTVIPLSSAGSAGSVSAGSRRLVGGPGGRAAEAS